MFSKSFIAPLFLLALSSSVNAHAAIAPALGVKGNPVRGDVQRPSATAPCGTINIAQNIDTSTAVQANANGSFSPSITNFNPGADGSRSIKTVQVDATGTGKSFVAAQMVVNGDPNPTSDTTEQLTVQLPAGTKCSGGANKDLCLASFTTTSGFGNCVVVSQGAGAAAAPSAVNKASPARKGAAKGVKRSADNSDAKAEKKSTDKKDKKDKKKGDNKKNDKGKRANKPQGNARAIPAAANSNIRRRSWSSRP
jgi:hypothetical protein